jgi:hypothetical protein
VNKKINVLKIENEHGVKDDFRYISIFEDASDAATAGFEYISRENEETDYEDHEWQMLEMDRDKGVFFTKKDQPDPYPCMYLRVERVERGDIHEGFNELRVDNWEVINDRLNIKKSSKYRSSQISKFYRSAN